MVMKIWRTTICKCKRQDERWSKEKENRDDTGDEKGLEYDEDQAVKEYEEYDEEEEYTEKDGDDRVQVSLLSFFGTLMYSRVGIQST